MNTLIKQALVFIFLTTLTGCCGCVDDSLPDLLSRDEIKEQFLRQFNDSEDVYEESLIYLNAAVKINKLFCDGEKCDKTETAGNHTNQVSVYYNATNPNPATWGDAHDAGTVEKNPLGSCEKVPTGGDMKFYKTGYFLVEILLDTYQKVKERNDGNNEYVRGGSRNGRMAPQLSEKEKNELWGNNRYTKLIYIDKPAHSDDPSKAVELLKVF